MAGSCKEKGGDSTTRRVCRGQPEGRLPLRRPKIRWKDQVADDMRKLWGDINMAEDRAVWRQLVGESKINLDCISIFFLSCHPIWYRTLKESMTIVPSNIVRPTQFNAT